MKEKVTNLVCVSGKITEKIQHLFGPYYTTVVSVERGNGKVDIFPLRLDYSLTKGLEIGTFVSLSGEIHHKRMLIKDWKNIINVFEINILNEEFYEQRAYLEGKVALRYKLDWKFEKQCQILLDAQRKHRDVSDYIEVYGFEKHAELMKDIKEGDYVRVIGKLQSRNFNHRVTGEKYLVLDVKISYIKKLY